MIFFVISQTLQILLYTQFISHLLVIATCQVWQMMVDTYAVSL